ncbi:DoxX family protein [Paraburkholderia lycopersici]|uniref:Putative oxidoreductase n=1 Tax=Paraburkholderia lycopersici TaxID=416944 RepID=A0A1G6Q6Z4_9BURK|nr:DoxX family protein [Paraburkholderia lycopersici]SDC87486.1 putative oxidoreductase [Paraburkholderia lycopersici]
MSQSLPRARRPFEFLIRAILQQIQSIAGLVAPPLLRVALALPFLRSGHTRWDGFLSISPATLFLFENQFKLHVFGAAYGFPAPDTVALIVATAEIALPVLLILGLATRFAALALLLMTGTIQLVFPDGWANFHLYWASLAVGIMALGPGPLSIDRPISQWFYRRAIRNPI